MAPNTPLLDEGQYLASVSSLSRILPAAGEGQERRRPATHPARVKPELVATRPNPVWSWDIADAARFVATLKSDLDYRPVWPTRAAARSAIVASIEGIYHPRRRHSTLGNLSPVASDQRHSLVAQSRRTRVRQTEHVQPGIRAHQRVAAAPDPPHSSALIASVEGRDSSSHPSPPTRSARDDPRVERAGIGSRDGHKIGRPAAEGDGVRPGGKAGVTASQI